MEPLVGRAAEQAAVARAIGSSGAVVVRGEPGVGKTALLEAALADTQDMRVLRASGAEGEAEIPYAGLAELVRPLAGRVRAGADLRPLALAIGAGEASGELFPVQVEAALERLLRENRPVVVAVDDAHWLDDASGAATKINHNVPIGTAGVPALLAAGGVQVTVASAFGTEQLPAGLRVLIGHRGQNSKARDERRQARAPRAPATGAE